MAGVEKVSLNWVRTAGPVSNPPYGVNSVRTFRAAHDRGSLLPNVRNEPFGLELSVGTIRRRPCSFPK